MSPNSIEDKQPILAVDDDCIVWSEDQLSVHGISPDNCQQVSVEPDNKPDLPSYHSKSTLVHIDEDLPPKYESEDISALTPTQSFLRTLRSILLGHLWIKLLVIHLLLIYRTGTSTILSSFESLNWDIRGCESRTHSRDFLNIHLSGPSEDELDWSTGRLGKAGLTNPFLTLSEMALISEVEWEAEPSQDTTADDKLYFDSMEESTFKHSSTEGDKLPLPLRRPSSFFSFSSELFGQSKHGLTQSVHPGISRSLTASR